MRKKLKKLMSLLWELSKIVFLEECSRALGKHTKYKYIYTCMSEARLYKSIHIVRLTMRHHLFLEFWSVDTWIIADWRHHRAVTRLENVRQSNIRRGKKFGVQLSHKRALYITIFEKMFKSNFNFEPFKKNKKIFLMVMHVF